MWIVFALAALAVSLAPASAADCPFGRWGSYGDTELFRTADGQAYLWVTASTAIDADGSPRAYHPDDVGRRCGPSGVGLDCPANAGYPSTDWWPTVLAANPRTGRAFVQPSGPNAGFFVSMTALFDPSNGNARDPGRYVDASSVPYIVFPKPFYDASGTGRLGDVGIAYQMATNQQTPFIVADIGPDEPLGEASIAFFKALGGNDPNPRTGSGVAPGPTLYLVFPDSVRARETRWPVSNDELGAQVEGLLAKIDGEAVLAACVERFR